jgi:hypothetical protein
MLFTIEDANFTMYVRIVIEKEKQIILNSFLYKVYVNFVYKKSGIDIVRIPTDTLNNILEKYRKLINSELFVKSLSNSKKENKNLIIKIKAIFSYKRISPAFFSAIDIISIDGFSRKPIGRTIIELDADIINLIPQSSSEKVIHISALHNCNVMLVNQTFSYQSKILHKWLIWIRRIVRIFSPFIPLILQSTYNNLPWTQFTFLALVTNPDLLNWMPSIIGSILGYFWYKYGPKYIFKIFINFVFGKAFK